MQARTEITHINKSLGVWIGAGAIILPGVTVGKVSVIAARSVVTKGMEKNCLYAGVPARILYNPTTNEFKSTSWSVNIPTGYITNDAQPTV